MKKTLLTLVLLTATASNAAEVAKPYMLKLDYAAPTERENGEKITQDEISGYMVWHIDCDNPEYNEPTVPLLKNVQSYWFASDKPEQCLSFVTVDTDGQLSVHSEIFIARDFRAPEAATCTP